MTRILQIVPNMHSAGLENLLMNIYRNVDRNKIQFDFLVHYSGKYDFDDEITEMGGKIYHFPVMEDKNIVRYYLELIKFFKQHPEYKVIHGHMPSLGFIYMNAAKKAGVPVRIMHSHNASASNNLKGKVKGIAVKFAKYPSNYLLACSEKAGEFQYGKSEFKVMHNAIDAKKFSYNPKIRDEVRKELGLFDEIAFLHIGRFTKQKNHNFLLDIFDAFLKLEPNSKLFLMGEGELLQEIRELVINKKLSDKVIFLGVRKDAWRIYQACDMFLLPSLHEGLPVVGIETQAAGLMSIMADTVTTEVDITGLVRFVPLESSAAEWANEIQAIRKSGIERTDTYEKIVEAGYDMCHEASKIQDMYINLYNQASGGMK